MMWFERLPLGRYAPGDSRIHRLDPRAKILAVGFLLAASFFPNSPAGFAAALTLLLYALWASGVGSGAFLRGLLPVWSLLVFSILLHAFATPGDSLWPSPLLGLTWTRQGWLAGLGTAGRLALAAGFASLLTLTTPPASLVAGLRRLSAPGRRLGLPVDAFYHSVHLALRMLPALGEEMDAALRRRPKGTSWSCALEDLLRRLLRRASALGREAEPTRLPTPTGFSRGDWAALALSAATPALAFWLGRGGGT